MFGLRGKLAAAALAVVAMAVGTPASAGPIDVTSVGLDGYPPGITLTLSGGILGAGSENTLAGLIYLTTSNDGTLDTFCVDLFHDIYLGNNSYTYDPEPFTTNNDGSGPGSSDPLTALQESEIASLAALGLGTQSNGADWEAAIQAAIWEIEYGITVTPVGGCSADEQFCTDLAEILDELGSLPQGYGYEIGDCDNSGCNSQSQYVSQNLYVPTGVPEPLTLSLFGAGLIGLGALRRRKVGKNA